MPRLACVWRGLLPHHLDRSCQSPRHTKHLGPVGVLAFLRLYASHLGAPKDSARQQLFGTAITTASRGSRWSPGIPIPAKKSGLILVLGPVIIGHFPCIQRVPPLQDPKHEGEDAARPALRGAGCPGLSNARRQVTTAHPPVARRIRRADGLGFARGDQAVPAGHQSPSGAPQRAVWFPAHGPVSSPRRSLKSMR